MTTPSLPGCPLHSTPALDRKRRTASYGGPSGERQQADGRSVRTGRNQSAAQASTRAHVAQTAHPEYPEAAAAVQPFAGDEVNLEALSGRHQHREHLKLSVDDAERLGALLAVQVHLGLINRAGVDITERRPARRRRSLLEPRIDRGEARAFLVLAASRQPPENVPLQLGLLGLERLPLVLVDLVRRLHVRLRHALPPGGPRPPGVDLAARLRRQHRRAVLSHVAPVLRIHRCAHVRGHSRAWHELWAPSRVVTGDGGRRASVSCLHPVRRHLASIVERGAARAAPRALRSRHAHRGGSALHVSSSSLAAGRTRAGAQGAVLVRGVAQLLPQRLLRLFQTKPIVLKHALQHLVADHWKS